MIYIDIDGVLVDFIGTARKLGKELAPNEFGKWKWWTAESSDGIDPKQFYSIAEPQPWAVEIYDILRQEIYPAFITKDYVNIKARWLERKCISLFESYIEAPDKSVHCEHPCDVLIDDCLAECERWRAKGGIAWHFDLAQENPFGLFLNFWRLEK